MIPKVDYCHRTGPPEQHTMQEGAWKRRIMVPQLISLLHISPRLTEPNVLSQERTRRLGIPERSIDNQQSLCIMIEDNIKFCLHLCARALIVSIVHATRWPDALPTISSTSGGGGVVLRLPHLCRAQEDFGRIFFEEKKSHFGVQGTLRAEVDVRCSTMLSRPGNLFMCGTFLIRLLPHPAGAPPNPFRTARLDRRIQIIDMQTLQVLVIVHIFCSAVIFFQNQALIDKLLNSNHRCVNPAGSCHCPFFVPLSFFSLPKSVFLYGARRP